ncbi:MAG TPA: hypothetical protein VHA10_24220 [Hypericibacter adhaerens]|jgi:hypothetical protein|uniref:Uncharacterized protein n=1 Tax=Hypericibacter adhaerens TaxID=2602016 RepID=A0A5J6MZD7_9PROT|nr:hypothetical protein [Hypericibacter adhaerens]QEX21995.1 hypothetical protein FRZ61_19240 [Hypericibacter adhaerens]HWA46346.1 hypothetical protein [Hypericibacter adhaerens]
MKKALLATAGSALALVLLSYSMPASADVDVHVTVNKTKDITVSEFITISKTVLIDVTTNVTYHSAAEADAIVNQTNNDNTVTHTVIQLKNAPDSDEPPPEQQLNNFGLRKVASITNSINTNTGIVNVNQDVGNMSNQGNQVALAVSTPANTGNQNARPVLTNSQSESDQSNYDNHVVEIEHPNPETDFFTSPYNESASIDGSINGNIGVVNVNQNAGNMNNQANSEALAVALDLAGVALSEAALGQVNTDNAGSDETGSGSAGVFEAGVNKLASATGSLNGNTGIGGVNQSAGNMANQANTFSLSFIDAGGGVGLVP